MTNTPPRKKFKKSLYNISQTHDSCDIIKDEKIILFLEKDESKVLEGMGVIHCLNGVVEINGFEFTPKCSPSKFYSFSNHRLLTIKALPFKENISIKNLKSMLKELNVDSNAIEEVKEKLKLSFVSIVLLSKILPEFKYLEGIERFSYLTRPDGVRVSNKNNELITFPEEYLSVCSKWDDLLKNDKAPVLLLCGGKNTGKSTFARFLINRTLNRKKKVAFLECDVGQTEFIPPGCVGLNLIVNPILGPPYCHQQLAEIMSFVGLTNTKLDPQKYLNCIKSVWNHRQKNHPHVPTVINTMGWCRNLGVSILAEVVEITRPTLVIQLDGPLSRDNFPLMTAEFVNNLKLGLMDYYPFQKKSLDAEQLSYALHPLQIPFERTLSYSAKVTAADYRSLSLMTYFVQGSAPPESDGNLRIASYTLSYEKLALHSCHRDVPGHLLIDLFEKNICSLCIVDDNLIEESHSETLPKFLREFPNCRTLGLGFVLSVSKEDKTLDLITNVCTSLVEEVNSLIVGMVEPPKMMSNLNENVIENT